MAFWNLAVYPGPVADSPEVRAENAALEQFGIGGSVTLPGEALDSQAQAEEDADLALLARCKPIGGTSVGKQVCRVKVEDAVEEFVDRFAWGPYPVVYL